MKIELTGPGCGEGSALRAHAERRFLSALGRFASRLQQVRIRVRDVNGPRGGVDKNCTVEIHGLRIPVLRVQVLDAQVETALDRAADIVRRVVVRALERSRWNVRRHRAGWPAGA